MLCFVFLDLCGGLRVPSPPTSLFLRRCAFFYHQEHPSLSTGGDGNQASPPVPDGKGHHPVLIDGIDVSFSASANPGLPHPDPLTQRQPDVATPVVTDSANSVAKDEAVVEDVEGMIDSHPRTGSENASPNGRETVLAPGDADVCDLLLGYFRYCAEDFCHAKQVGEQKKNGGGR